MRFGSVLAVIAAAWVAAAPSSAEACDCAQYFAVSPPTDAKDVPTNTWIRVTGTNVTDVLLEQADGGAVDVEVRQPTGDPRTRYLVPRAPLEKSGVYVIRDSQSELSRFSVTADADVLATHFAGIRDFTFSESGHFQPESSCGPTRAYDLTLFGIGEDSTPSGDFFFHVYVGRSEDTIDLARPALVLPPGITSIGQRPCGPHFDLDPNPEPWVVMTALDRAGNETKPGRPVQLTQGCGCGATEGNVPLFAIFAAFGAWLMRASRKTNAWGRRDRTSGAGEPS